MSIRRKIFLLSGILLLLFGVVVVWSGVFRSKLRVFVSKHFFSYRYDYRAEWLRNRIFELFTKPAYFPDLETRGLSVLIGGRGTGKTTVLRTLSYEGKFALSNQDVSSIAEWPYYGGNDRIKGEHAQIL